MSKVLQTTYKILTSRKGQLGLLGLVILVGYAFYVKAEFGVFAMAIIGILTAMGLGMTIDKKIEGVKNDDNKQTPQ